MQVFVRAKICPNPCKRGLNVSELFQKHFAAANVSRARKRGYNIIAKKCFAMFPNNVSSFWRDLMTTNYREIKKTVSKRQKMHRYWKYRLLNDKDVAGKRSFKR